MDHMGRWMDACQAEEGCSPRIRMALPASRSNVCTTTTRHGHLVDATGERPNTDTRVSLRRPLTGRCYLTSNRRADDQAPGVPDASTARTLHHMRVVGSVLVENVEADTVWLTTGDEKPLWSSIWMM